MYLVEQVSGAVGGTWKLRIATRQGEKGLIRGAYSVRPRFELSLPQAPDDEAQRGVPTTIEVIPMDNGKAIAGLEGVTVWVEDASGKTVAQTQASGWLRTVLGKDIALPEGQYVAVVTLSQAGRYVAKARHVFGAEPGVVVTAERSLTIR